MFAQVLGMGTQYLAIRAKLKPRTVNQIGNPTDYISQNSEVNVQEKRNDNGHTRKLLQKFLVDTF
jgi:hypothetical protein